LTATALQSPPRGAGTPQRFSPSADLAQRRAARLHGQDEGKQIGRPLIRPGRHRGVALGAAAELVGEVGRIQVGRSAQLDAARLGRLGALGIHHRSSCRIGQEQGTDGPNYHEFQGARPCPEAGQDIAHIQHLSDF
jgi:hypothetical protein